MQRKRKVEETKTQVQHIKVQQVSGASGNKNYCVGNSGTGEHGEIIQFWGFTAKPCTSTGLLIPESDYKIFFQKFLLGLCQKT